jgi:hypothetical protein
VKVNIDKTIILSEEQRVQIANVIDGRVTRREAKRDEVKEYIWEAGSDWAERLSDDFRSLTEDPDTVDEEDGEDLIGEDGDDLDDLL